MNGEKSNKGKNTGSTGSPGNTGLSEEAGQEQTGLQQGEKQEFPQRRRFRFDRMELAGSLGDLGTILPLAVGMIVINGLNPMGVFVGVGLFYILSGLYFRITCPVEPMKVVAGYAIASGIAATQIQAASLWLFAILLIVGSSGLIDLVGRFVSKPVIRGVQLTTGLLLLGQGVRLMMGNSSLQRLGTGAAAEAGASGGLMHASLGTVEIVSWLPPLPLGLLLALALCVLTLLLLDNKKLPAAVVIVAVGFGVGVISRLFHGSPEGGGMLGAAALVPGFHLPSILPYGLPSATDFSLALLLIVLPQVPMTIGNAVIANSDLSRQYFPESGKRVSYRTLCLSMSLANLGSFLLGGMPMCHGAGGLASRYRFGARTGGSNLIIGMIFLAVALLFGSGSMMLIQLLPFEVLGVLLFFAGAQLGMTVTDMNSRRELFVVVLIAGIALVTNLAVGFVVGCVVAALLRWERLSV